jgi:hypothetical protein
LLGSEEKPRYIKGLMLLDLSDRLHRVSTGWITTASLLIFLLFTVLVLPGQASRSEVTTGDVGSPDMSFYYSADDLYQMAKSYGKEGRAEYIRARFTFDLVWPLVYGFFLSIGISWTSRKAFFKESTLQRTNIAPVLGVLFDYLENISTSLVMARYPSSTPVIDWLASIFTMLKWLFVTGSFVLLLAGFLIGILRWVSIRKSS